MRTPEELPLPDGFIADGMNGLERFIKRAFDLLVALVSIIVSTPVFLLCWILVKWDDGGKAIFSTSATFHALTIIRRLSGFFLIVSTIFAIWSIVPPL